MGYNTDVISRARARLAGAKADKESQYNQHLQEAYKKVPRLSEIDRIMRTAMSKTAMAVYAKGTSFQEAFDQVKNENLALQREREELIEKNFRKGFLDKGPLCPCCNDSGYVGNAMCKCLLELCIEEQKKTLPALNEEMSFDNFSLDRYSGSWYQGVNGRKIMERALKTCRDFAITFGKGSPSLLFTGGTGLGKTFLSLCIANAVIDRGYSVTYESASHFFETAELAKFKNDPNAQYKVSSYIDSDLLIIDDLGTELAGVNYAGAAGEFTVSTLYNLINDRMLNGKSTIISTNYTISDIENRYGSRIASRLESFSPVAFCGNDIRRPMPYNG